VVVNGHSAALLKGTPVIWKTTTGYDGYSVLACAAGYPVCGVLCDDVDPGEPVVAQTGGSISDGCGYVITTGTVTAADFLIPGTANATGDVAADTQLAKGNVFCYAAADTASNKVSSGHLFCFG
jgi:hypothetical protein